MTFAPLCLHPVPSIILQEFWKMPFHPLNQPAGHVLVFVRFPIAITVLPRGAYSVIAAQTYQQNCTRLQGSGQSDSTHPHQMFPHYTSLAYRDWSAQPRVSQPSSPTFGLGRLL